MTDIAAFLEDEPDDPALIAVIAMVVEFPSNSIECSGQVRLKFYLSYFLNLLLLQAVPQLVCDVIKRSFASGQNQLSDTTFVNLLHIAGYVQNDNSMIIRSFLNNTTFVPNP